MPTVSFVNQQQAGGALHGQRNRLGFAGVEYRFELHDQGTITRRGDLQPARSTGVSSRFKRGGGRKGRSASDFLPDSGRHQYFAVQKA